VAGTENVAAGITTPDLSAGSVTVLQAPFKKTFTLNMGGNQLILKKGYKLQDINITSTFGGTAVEITHPTAGLASVDVKCGAATTTPCVEVKGAGSHILKDVRVDAADANGGTIGILNNDPSINLTIIGGRVRSTGNAGPVTLIQSKGVLTVTGLTVDMTNGGHLQKSIGIVLKVAGSSVTNSTIKVNDGPNAANKAIGIDVQAGPSTVASNNFIGFGNNTVGINGAGNLSPASVGNNFSGVFGAPIQ
jgi:hypothetical protein